MIHHHHHHSHWPRAMLRGTQIALEWNKWQKCKKHNTTHSRSLGKHKEKKYRRNSGGTPTKGLTWHLTFDIWHLTFDIWKWLEKLLWSYEKKKKNCMETMDAQNLKKRQLDKYLGIITIRAPVGANNRSQRCIVSDETDSAVRASMIFSYSSPSPSVQLFLLNHHDR